MDKKSVKAEIVSKKQMFLNYVTAAQDLFNLFESEFNNLRAIIIKTVDVKTFYAQLEKEKRVKELNLYLRIVYKIIDEIKSDKSKILSVLSRKINILEEALAGLKGLLKDFPNVNTREQQNKEKALRNLFDILSKLKEITNIYQRLYL